MFDAKAMLYVYVETPLHAGSGASLGVVDLPIQRERVTGYPMIQASGIKGKLRAEAYARREFVERKEALIPDELGKLSDQPDWQLKTKDQREREADKRARKRAAKELGLEVVFGPETDDASEHAGAFTPSDARLLLLPVRSLFGVFAWTTSEDALARFYRDASHVGVSLGWEPCGPSDGNSVLVTSNSEITADDNNVVLEEFAFNALQDQRVTTIAQWLSKNAFPLDTVVNGKPANDYSYWREKLLRSLVILPKNAFQDFTRFSIEVINRIRLEAETKTVAEGALWSEEHLPADTLLYAPLLATKPRAAQNNSSVNSDSQVLTFVKKLGLDRVQLGGDETVGRGIVKLRFS